MREPNRDGREPNGERQQSKKAEKFVFLSIFLFCFQTSLPNLINFQFLFYLEIVTTRGIKNRTINVWFFDNFLCKIISNCCFFLHKGTYKLIFNWQFVFVWDLINALIPIQTKDFHKKVLNLWQFFVLLFTIVILEI